MLFDLQAGAHQKPVACSSIPSSSSWNSCSSACHEWAVQVPEGMRLVALAAVVKSQCGVSKGPQGAKGVVFLSSRAGVDFHHAVLGRVYEGMMDEPLLPCPLFRLHGSLSQVGIWGLHACMKAPWDRYKHRLQGRVHRLSAGFATPSYCTPLPTLPWPPVHGSYSEAETVLVSLVTCMPSRNCSLHACNNM